MSKQTDPVSLFATPIGCITSPAGDPVPITETLYRTTDGQFVIKTYLHDDRNGKFDIYDVILYANEADLREAISASKCNNLWLSLLAANGF